MVTTVCFARDGKAYRPEIDAYCAYLNEQSGYVAKAVTSDDPHNGCDLLWLFAGVLQKSHRIPVVHEYASLSTGRAPHMKDRVKRLLNSTPTGRVFLSQYVVSEMGFPDEVPFILRDMGVPDSFFRLPPSQTSYDFVYSGTIASGRGSTTVLDWFSRSDMTLLMVGDDPEKLQRRYARCRNIAFAGSVPHNEVAELLSMARYGLAYTPPKRPWGHQTSTKLLEYLAAGLHVCTNSTPWVDRFAGESGAGMMFVRDDLADLTEERLKQTSFSRPDMDRFRWTNILDRAELTAFIDQLVS